MAGLLDGNEIWLVPSSGPAIPLEFIAPIDFQMSRGTDHDSVKFLTSDDRFNNVGAGPCKFRFKTPEKFGGGYKQFEWDGWYMASIQPNSARPGTFLVTLHDERWLAAKNKVTVGYNVDWPDERGRAETKTSAGDWTCVNAAKDALARFGLTVDDDVKTLTAKQVAEVLPRNLGNSPAGGWTAASFSELIPALLEPIRCDIIMTPQRKVRIVSRSGYDDSPKLKVHGLIGGVVGERNIKWQLPKKIRVEFERLVEGAFEIVPGDSSRRTASAGGSDLNWWVENVMPLWVWNGNIQAGEYTEMYAQLESALNSKWATEQYIGQRWFKPHLFPYPRDPKTRRIIQQGSAAELAASIAKRSWFDDMVRQCWRRVFRVTPKVFNGSSYARYFTNIRLGRLEKNGGVKDGGNVFMPYVKQLRWGRLPANAQGDSPLQNIFTENHHFGNPANSSAEEQYSYDPAPFTARWVSPEKLVFEVRPDRPDNINSKAFFAGTMAEHLNYGPLFRLEGGAALKVTEAQGVLKGGTTSRQFYMRVIYNGRVSAAMPGSVDRMYAVEKDAFPNGIGRDVTVKAGESVTANFVFTEDALKLPIDGSLMNNTLGRLHRLANPDEVDDVAQFIADQVKQTYVQNRAGVATVEGVGALVAGIWTGGLINHCAITVGQGMNEAILVQYTVQPEVRPIESSRKKPEKAPRRAVEE